MVFGIACTSICDCCVSPYLAAIWSEGPRHCKEDTLLASKELSNVDFCLWAIMQLHWWQRVTNLHRCWAHLLFDQSHRLIWSRDSTTCLHSHRENYFTGCFKFTIHCYSKGHAGGLCSPWWASSEPSQWKRSSWLRKVGDDTYARLTALVLSRARAPPLVIV